MLRSAFQKGVLPNELLEMSALAMNSWHDVNAIITPTHTSFKKEAANSSERISKGEPLSRLDGLPFAVKDNFTVSGFKTTCGSKILEKFVPSYTATCVSRLLQSGMVLVGKTNLDEFAMGNGTTISIFGPTRNPWTYSKKLTSRSTCLEGSSDFYIAGGSSGGSAAAVATNCAVAALGSDTGGSVRLPAAYCGIVGLKPSYSLVSRHGLISLENSCDTPGILACDVQTAVDVLNVMAGPDKLDSTCSSETYKPVVLSDYDHEISKIKVGIPKEYHVPGLTKEVRDCWSEVADLIANKCLDIAQVSLPHTELATSCYTIIACSEVASNMARYDSIKFGHRAQDESSTEALYAATRREGFNMGVRCRVLAGNYFLMQKNKAEYYDKAVRMRNLICRDFHQVFSNTENPVDILVCPATLGDAPLYSSFVSVDDDGLNEDWDALAQPVNLAGLPAVVIPVKLSSNGLPLAIQLIAPAFKEQMLLNVARWLEKQLDFPGLDTQM